MIYCLTNNIGVIAVPAQFAQQVADKLVKANIKGIWNFAPVKMRVPEDVKIVNEDLSVGLSRLSYYITGKYLSFPIVKLDAFP